MAVRADVSLRRVAAVVTATLVTMVNLSCSGSNEPKPTAADYVDRLEIICAQTATQLDALPEPPADITVTAFATQASVILRSEAEHVRSADPPDEMGDDHRALILNDEEQAAAWGDLADAVGGDDASFAEITTRIAELNLGRSDLVTEMGAPGCVRLPE